MTEHSGADRVGHGEASLGDAQSSNPPDDPEMIAPDAPPRDADTDYEGEGEEPPEERGNDQRALGRAGAPRTVRGAGSHRSLAPAAPGAGLWMGVTCSRRLRRTPACGSACHEG